MGYSDDVSGLIIMAGTKIKLNAYHIITGLLLVFMFSSFLGMDIYSDNEMVFTSHEWEIGHGIDSEKFTALASEDSDYRTAEVKGVDYGHITRAYPIESATLSVKSDTDDSNDYCNIAIAQVYVKNHATNGWDLVATSNKISDDTNDIRLYSLTSSHINDAQVDIKAVTHSEASSSTNSCGTYINSIKLIDVELDIPVTDSISDSISDLFSSSTDDTSITTDSDSASSSSFGNLINNIMLWFGGLFR